jgi:hypothetical protein
MEKNGTEGSASQAKGAIEPTECGIAGNAKAGEDRNTWSPIGSRVFSCASSFHANVF